METCLKIFQIEHLCHGFGFKVGIYVDYMGIDRHHSGGLPIYWLLNMDISMISYSLHHIQLIVHATSSMP